ncbi:DotU family type IV/VI secretion system protein [Corallococcus sp. H22C18031201]|uniref:DotU family type IV/VI secretion system protein n=1 Tax=Citreicoccus inhibens TaxID=2849499 RepID=UPI000E716C5B|nr:DotU family type IV/VI secretion system protein [Citreicoccus inhibens]MBU8900702.1 DotU family type IV/VI secretion system protein [Citreicoccus inhibens]RJS14504.1 DotU family type IV/VI secretion system protein [Corallococcus sp. H22C18031201]
MDRVTEATKDCLDAAIQLRNSDATAVPPPETLHHRLRGVVDEMLRRAAVLGFSHQDAQDMAYGVVALIDEVVLNRPEEYRQFWMTNPLQLHYFNENIAGDGFFNRLNSIRKDPHRAEVLQVYYLCMLFGFQGRYRIRGGELELMTLIDTVQKDLERAKPFDFDVLSPHGDRPTETLLSQKKKASVMTLSAGALALALLLYGGLVLTLNNKVSTLLKDIEVHMARNTGGGK